MKNYRRQMGSRTRWIARLCMLGLIALAAQQRSDAQGTAVIENQTIASGGGLMTGGGAELYSTIGEPLASDSIRIISDETTWTGFWELLPIRDSLSSVQELHHGGAVAATRIVGAHPNPFEQTIEISVHLTHSGNVQLIAYDMMGREVERVVDGEREAGVVTLIWHPGALGAGSYLLRLAVDGDEMGTRLVHYRR